MKKEAAKKKPTVAAKTTAATKPAAKPATPQEGVRERAARLHEELRKLEEQKASGEIGDEEYARRRRELEGG